MTNPEAGPTVFPQPAAPEPVPTKRGLIYTFYSYKGGVGRSMALANVAALLAKWGKKVLVVDWDLEAPGIERFFQQEPSTLSGSRDKTPGLLDLLLGFRQKSTLDWRDCLLSARPFPFGPTLSVLTAGQAGKAYVHALQSLDWEDLFERHSLGDYLERLRADWVREFDAVLVDSRTGVTDIGGICTILLPDVVVLLVNTSHQSLDGILEVMRRARAGREELPVERTRLVTVPVLARDERLSEYELADAWKNRMADQLSELYRDWLPPGTTAVEVLNKLYIPQVAYWSFGERLPVAEAEDKLSDSASIVAAYGRLARFLWSELDWTQVRGDDDHKALEDRARVERARQQTLWLHDRVHRDYGAWGLARLWFIWAFAIFAVIVIQSILGKYGGQVREAWSWFIPTIVPTLSLMIGVLGAAGMQNNDDIRTVRKSFYIVTWWISAGYLVILSLTVLLQPFAPATTSPIELYILSTYWLAPLQAVVGSTIGVLFTSQQRGFPEGGGPLRGAGSFRSG